MAELLKKYQKYSTRSFINIEEVFKYQEIIFFQLLGVYPKRGIRILSPFRKDRTPGCRFDYYNGMWFFIDNAGYKEKISFNCIDLIMFKYNLNFADALQETKKILGSTKYHELLFNSKEANLPKERYEIGIKFKYGPWPEKNYFTDNYGISVKYLSKEPTYLTTDYWTNTRSSKELLKNRFTSNPIAYYFEETKHVKLYFPSKDLKFFANISKEDIFGHHRMDSYLKNIDKALFITKSGKDEICLNYYLEANSLAVQSETIKDLPDYLLRNIANFNPIYIWFDLDKTGILGAKNLKNYLLKYFDKDIIIIYHNHLLGNDIADIVEKAILYKTDPCRLLLNTLN